MTVGIVFMIISILAFVMILTEVLPRFLLKLKYIALAPSDRGVKKMIFEDKRCILYEGGKEINKYIKQYVLIDDVGCKVLRCKTTRPTNYINYDVVSFNRYGEIIKVINVNERLVHCDFTRRVELPKETSYIKIILKQVDDEAFKTEPLWYIPRNKIRLYVILSTVLSLLEIYALKICCAYAFGEVFREDFIRSYNGAITILILSIAMGLITFITVKKSINRHKNQ